MTAPPDRRAIITEALRKIDDLTARLEIAEKADVEPIAVVGMACRLPGGVSTPADYWQLLRDGDSGVIRVPEDRWGADAYFSSAHTRPGTICNREGGFLPSWRPDEFDAEFFGISPREAVAMDPQQRLLLEVCWEALEGAGGDPLSLRGSRTGVFAGAAPSGYGVQLSLRDAQNLNQHLMTGNAGSVITGRVSYLLGLEGPAVTVDPPCSSSRVALPLAGQALRAGECDLALAGGVTIMATPGELVSFSRQAGLAGDGRCKAF